MFHIIFFNVLFKKQYFDMFAIILRPHYFKFITYLRKMKTFIIN
jgi:hypothetical protein